MELSAPPATGAPQNPPCPPAEDTISPTATSLALLSIWRSPARAGSVPRPTGWLPEERPRKPPLPQPCHYGHFSFLFLTLICRLCGCGAALLPGAAGPWDAMGYGEGTHPAKAQPSADTEHPSLTPPQTGPPDPNQLFSVAVLSPTHLSGGTWQQVPAPARLILLRATRQGLTGINTSARPLATCHSIRGANLPAPHAAGRGAARSRLASSPEGHRGLSGCSCRA